MKCFQHHGRAIAPKLPTVEFMKQTQESVLAPHKLEDGRWWEGLGFTKTSEGIVRRSPKIISVGHVDETKLILNTKVIRFKITPRRENQRPHYFLNQPIFQVEECITNIVKLAGVKKYEVGTTITRKPHVDARVKDIVWGAAGDYIIKHNDYVSTYVKFQSPHVVERCTFLNAFLSFLIFPASISPSLVTVQSACL